MRRGPLGRLTEPSSMWFCGQNISSVSTGQRAIDRSSSDDVNRLFDVSVTPFSAPPIRKGCLTEATEGLRQFITPGHQGHRHSASLTLNDRFSGPDCPCPRQICPVRWGNDQAGPNHVAPAGPAYSWANRKVWLKMHKSFQTMQVHSETLVPCHPTPR